MRYLYTLAVYAYYLVVVIAAWLGNVKARKWVEGRKHIWDAPEPPHAKDADWIWFHVSSLGEFEQARPLIEKIKAECPQKKILLSFFSPSGYEIRKDYQFADHCIYLPIDTTTNARRLLDRYHITMAVFVKYEFWFNYIKVLHDRSIPLLYISVILRPNQYFFRWYGRWFRKQLLLVSRYFVQDERTADLLAGIGAEHVEVCGDTRFDRVYAIATTAKPFPMVKDFINGRSCVVIGSSWPADERLIRDFLTKMPDDYCLIIAPHDVSAPHVSAIQSWFSSSQRYSDYNPDTACNVLIIDTIGILSQLYQYARFVYVGGGFGVNIHNIQEPVVYGCPVVFGPKYHSFKEAVDLVELGGAFSVSNQQELNNVFLCLMHDDETYLSASKICIDYVNAQVGATDAIMRVLQSEFRHS